MSTGEAGGASEEYVTVPRSLLQTVFDVAISSMDFSSGFLDHEEVTALRECATFLGVDPLVATPANLVCQFKGAHDWQPVKWPAWVSEGANSQCRWCHRTSVDRPADAPEQCSP